MKKKREGERAMAQPVHMLLLALLFAASTKGTDGVQPTSCKLTCGSLTIPYPFGIGDGCYDKGYGKFNISCNQSEQPPKAFIDTSNIEILSIDLNTGKLRVQAFIGYDCYYEGPAGGNITFNQWLRLGIRYPYTFSHTRNSFFAVGCDSQAYIVGRGDEGKGYAGGCLSYCNKIDVSADVDGTCSGVGCCKTAIPKGLRSFSTDIRSLDNHTNCWHFNPCTYAFIAEEGSYTFRRADLNSTNTGKELPVVLNWSIGDKTCEEAKKGGGSTACVSRHSECFNSESGIGYICNCSEGYQGNPYLRGPQECIDIDECTQNPRVCPPNSTCTNTMGSYYCTCSAGTNAAGDLKKSGTCDPTRHDAVGSNNDHISLRLKLGLGVGVALLLLLAAISCLCWGFQRVKFVEQTRKVAELKERLFEQNGGLFLRELITPSHAFRIFTEEELAMATDDFDENQIAGRGGHGIVYKGRLADDTKIAIKKSKMVDERQSKEFAREIGILSQINHVNVVKLLGCCLEVEIPMLVYEYVERGTLYDFIHHPKNKNTPISLFTRMKIATEAAEALAYLHSYASRPILHGDVKTSNILLDEHYRAKISDFGASTLMAPTDEVQLATVVQGTCGYLDPEFLQTYQLTAKSDVYSFGVVLAEILTGKQPFQLHSPEDERGLAVTFVSALREKKLLQILDAQVVEYENPEQLWEIAQVVCRCLSAKGEDRPTMKEVAKVLQAFTERADTKERFLCWNRSPPVSEEIEAVTQSLLTAGVELSIYESSLGGVDTSSSYMISLQNRADIEAGR